MEIAPQCDDDPEFVRQAVLAVNGILRRHTPAALVVIKIDNWFGWKWLGFSGKALGAIGVWRIPSDRRPESQLRVPPFVPERVVSQRRFTGPSFEEIDPGKPVHLQVPSGSALRRKVTIEEPKTALAWYSGNSKENGRGALMVYVPVGASHWPWYVELQREEPWHVSDAWRVRPEWNIRPDEFADLMKKGSVSLAGSSTL
jgi:hypothetical protein